MSEPRRSIVQEIIWRMEKQDEKWGTNRNLNYKLWLVILIEEVGEVARAILEKDVVNLRYELLDVAAVACSFIENIDNNIM